MKRKGLFLSIAGFQLITCLLLISRLGLTLINEIRDGYYNSVYFSLPIILICVIVGTFPGISIYVLQKKYPAQILSKPLQRIFDFCMVIYFLCTMIMLMGAAYGICVTFQYFTRVDGMGSSDHYSLFLGIYAILLAAGMLYLLNAVTRLKVILKRNHAELENSNIEALGSHQ